MKTTVRSLAVLLFVFAAACATQYRSIDDSVSGGFTETRLAPDMWRVRVEGNGFTRRDEAQQFLFRRCAELTLEQGKRYFLLEGHEAWTRVELTSVGAVGSPADEAVMTVLDERNAHAFDAAEIIAQTNEAAGGRLSAPAKKTLAEIAR